MPRRGLPTVRVQHPTFLRQMANRPSTAFCTTGVANGYDFGSPDHLDDIGPQGTHMAWVNVINTTGGLRNIIGKVIGAQRTRLNFQGAFMQFLIDRGTSDLSILSNAFGLAGNEWTFVTAVWDLDGANGDQRLYVGRASHNAREVSSYTQQLVGSGSRSSDAAGPQHISAPSASAQVFAGHIGFAAIWERQLSLGEIREQQWRPHPSHKVKLFCFPNTRGPIRDLSPFRLLGTSTGIEINPYNPLPMGVDIGLNRPMVGLAPAAPALLIRDPIMAQGIIPFAR